MATFALEPDESAKLDAWLEEHEKKTGHMSGYAGAIGGVLTYKLTGTSLGMVVKAVCTRCQEEVDLSDYENW